MTLRTASVVTRISTATPLATVHGGQQFLVDHAEQRLGEQAAHVPVAAVRRVGQKPLDDLVDR
jgi:hypothetical protein